MSDKTSIQWTDYTWSPWLGCRKVSPGCENCYITTTTPFRTRKIEHGARRERTSAAYWMQPVRWNNYLTCDCGTIKAHVEHPCPYCPKCKSDFRLARVFPSLCDPFDPEVPQVWFNDFFRLILGTGNLTWLILTKRPEQIQERMQEFERITDIRWDGMPNNVWLGVSCEDQQRADERIPILLSIPAQVRFLSVEPMLERINLYRFFAHSIRCEKLPGPGMNGGEACRCKHPDWVIFGGESGKNARACNVEWIRDGVRQCKAAGIPAFVKQLGSSCGQVWSGGTGGIGIPLPIQHPKGGDPSEWPEDLRVREFPIA